jgi:hypothetical protein
MQRGARIGRVKRAEQERRKSLMSSIFSTQTQGSSAISIISSAKSSARRVVSRVQARLFDMAFTQPVVHELERIRSPTTLMIGQLGVALGRPWDAHRLWSIEGGEPRSLMGHIRRRPRHPSDVRGDDRRPARLNSGKRPALSVIRESRAEEPTWTPRYHPSARR